MAVFSYEPFILNTGCRDGRPYTIDSHPAMCAPGKRQQSHNDREGELVRSVDVCEHLAMEKIEAGRREARHMPITRSHDTFIHISAFLSFNQHHELGRWS